jgi:putative phage-type endonuclease
MAELLLEATTGEVKKLEPNEHMLRGTRLEPVARDYAVECIRRELGNDFNVSDVGSCYNIDRPWLAASPDGLTSDECVFEIKCPTTRNHLRAFQEGMPEKHLAQIYAEMYATERRGCYFISYNEEVSPDYRIYIQHVEWDEEIAQEFFEAVDLFADEFKTNLVIALKDVDTNPRIEAVRKTWGV